MIAKNFDIIIKLRAALLSIIVVTINSLLRITLFYFTKFVGIDSMTRFYSAYINRYILLVFVNSAFIPYLVHSKYDKTTEESLELLIIDIHFILLANAFATPISRFFDIDFFIKHYFRKNIKKYPP